MGLFTILNAYREDNRIMKQIKANRTYHWEDGTAMVKGVLKPYQMGLNSTEHKRYLDYISYCERGEIEVLYNSDWVVYETHLGIDCAPIDVFLASVY